MDKYESWDLFFSFLSIFIAFVGTIFVIKDLNRITSNYDHRRKVIYENVYDNYLKDLNESNLRNRIDAKEFYSRFVPLKEDILKYSSSRSHLYYYEFFNFLENKDGLESKKNTKAEDFFYRYIFLIVSLKEDYLGNIDSDINVEGFILTQYKQEEIDKQALKEIQRSVEKNKVLFNK